MAGIAPLITFKSGKCSLDTSGTPPKVQADPTPGYVYLYAGEDELLHFCWRPRSAPLSSPELDLIMFPSDATFTPYEPTSAENPSNSKKPTNGRIYVLKFSSSSQRHLFWLQSKSQHPSGNPAWFSARDLKLGEIVNTLLQGEDVDVRDAMASLPSDESGGGDDDETMEDVEGSNQDPNHHRGGSGGAGPDATGGDFREEGEPSREGGGDGARAVTGGANTDAASVIQNFIKSMGGGQQQQQSGGQEKLFTTLADLLTPATTKPLITNAPHTLVDKLLEYLPPSLLSLADDINLPHLPTSDSEDAAYRKKKQILLNVVQSPQFTQSLSSLTIALRDGGLPSISEALQVPVKNGGFMRRGGVPLGGGDAVEAFLDGVKSQALTKGADKDLMETD